MDSAHKTAIIIRGTITAVLFLAGFAFPLIWIAAAFFAYTTYSAFPDPEPDTPENMYRPRQSTVTADNPDWREYFLTACESPAETAFLEAMINGYGLKPDNGILIAAGIEMDMQTEYKPYRLDFLINKWLVVEVDGAAWHSSSEAVERDGIRDEFFKAKGFSVLRIPAKTVFQTPTKAVDMVRAAIARGRSPQKVVVKSPPISVAKTFTNSAKSVGKFLDDLDAHVTKATAIDKAIGPAKQAFSTEKTVVDSAMKTARQAVDLEAQLSADPNLRKHFDATHAELEELIQSTKAKYVRDKPEAPTTITISPITRPESHPDSKINAAILLAYLNLTGDRARYFNDVRAQISNDPRLSSHVKEHLERLGCHAVWTEIEKRPQPFGIKSDLL